MATGQEVLAFYELTTDQAMEFILDNIEQPSVIFQAALDAGITTQHLSDITGYSTDLIQSFFASHSLDTDELDNVQILFNSDLGNLSYLVQFNDRSGPLSTAALSEKTRLQIDSVDYDIFIEPIFFYQQADGSYTPDELGVSHLGNIPATDANIESLIYGTMSNIYSKLDDAELSQLKSFALDASNIDEYRSLFSDALNDIAVRSNDELANLVISETVTLIDKFWYGDVEVTGSLDLSLLGMPGIV